MTNLILEALIFCPYLADRPNFDRLAVSQFLTQSKNILQGALLYQHKWAKKLQIWISLFLWNRAHPTVPEINAIERPFFSFGIFSCIFNNVDTVLITLFPSSSIWVTSHESLLPESSNLASYVTIIVRPLLSSVSGKSKITVKNFK